MSKTNGRKPSPPGILAAFTKPDVLPPIVDHKSGGARTGSGTAKGVPLTPETKTRKQTSTAINTWLQQLFNSPAGRLALEYTIFAEPSVLIHCMDRAFGKVRVVMDLNHFGLEQYSDEELKAIQEGRALPPRKGARPLEGRA